MSNVLFCVLERRLKVGVQIQESKEPFEYRCWPRNDLVVEDNMNPVEFKKLQPMLKMGGVLSLLNVGWIVLEGLAKLIE